MISQENLKILTPLQKLSKNVADLGKLIVATGFGKLPKVQWKAKSGNTANIVWPSSRTHTQPHFTVSVTHARGTHMFNKHTCIAGTNERTEWTNERKNNLCVTLHRRGFYLSSTLLGNWGWSEAGRWSSSQLANAVVITPDAATA